MPRVAGRYTPKPLYKYDEKELRLASTSISHERGTFPSDDRKADPVLLFFAILGCQLREVFIREFAAVLLGGKWMPTEDEWQRLKQCDAWDQAVGQWLNMWPNSHEDMIVGDAVAQSLQSTA